MAHSAYCLEHAEELGLLSLGAYAFLDAGEHEEGFGHHGSQSCPNCGFSLRDWKRTGRFGCPECYEAFAEKIRPALERLHADTVHRGKIPRRAYSQSLVENRIRDLQRQLDEAVKEERFEDAAATRNLMIEFESWQGQS